VPKRSAANFVEVMRPGERSIRRIQPKLRWCFDRP
jgi:hypothetical protein